MKRQRGRGRGGKPGGGGHHNNHPNRAMESSGPEVKVRGPAAHIYERYLQLARDAASSGDRVLSENYMQHADHYFRLLRQMQPAMPVQQAQDRYGQDGDFDGDEDGGPEGDAAEAGADGGDQPDAEFPPSGGDQPPQQGFERDGDRGGRRRRGRRDRFRPGGEAEGGEPREGRDQSFQRDAAPRERDERPRGEEQPRRERREPRGERADGDQSREGFASGPGPRPAFLGSE